MQRQLFVQLKKKGKEKRPFRDSPNERKEEDYGLIW